MFVRSQAGAAVDVGDKWAWVDIGSCDTLLRGERMVFELDGTAHVDRIRFHKSAGTLSM